MRARLSCLKCPACLQNSSTSKLLPCLHSICQNCVEKCLKHSKVSEEECYQFECPICVKIVTKPPNELLEKQWAWHFPVNAVLLSSLQDTKTKVVQTCDPCMYVGESITATSYCTTCKEILCPACDGAHRKSRATRQHTFLRLDENVEPAVAVTLAVSMTCTYHWNKDVEFYCVPHNSMCCSECLDCHRGCNEILKLKEHVDTLLKADELSKLTEKMKVLEDHLEKFTAANDETQQELETSTEDMTTEIDKLIAILNEAKSRMSKEREGLLEGESRTRRSENQQCESLKATFRDFHHLLGAVVKYGDRHQSLVILHKVKESLAYCEKTIQDNNFSVRQVGAKLLLNEHLISLRKLTGSQIAKIEVTENKLKLDPCVHQNCSIRSDTMLTTTDEVLPSMTTTSKDLGHVMPGHVNSSGVTDRHMVPPGHAGPYLFPSQAAPFIPPGYQMNYSPYYWGHYGMPHLPPQPTVQHASGDVGLPATWTPMANDENLKCVSLNPKDQEYIHVSQKFLASAGVAGQQAAMKAFAMNYGSTGLTVIQIERVQNKSLYQQYKAKKRQLEQQNNGQANEKELWHGTASTSILNINHNGFNRSCSGSGSHGNGTYFAVNASYSVSGYCRVDASGHRHIYLAHVMTGDSIVLGSGTRVLPPKDPKNPHITYDSTTDNLANPQMFVIFHDTQAYPSYHITFC